MLWLVTAHDTMQRETSASYSRVYIPRHVVSRPSDSVFEWQMSCSRDRGATLRWGGGGGGHHWWLNIGGGKKHFFLLVLYNFKNIGRARAPQPPPPPLLRRPCVLEFIYFSPRGLTSFRFRVRMADTGRNINTTEKTLVQRTKTWI